MTDGRMDGQTDGPTDGRTTNDWMQGRTDERTKGQTDGRSDGWTDGPDVSAFYAKICFNYTTPTPQSEELLPACEGLVKLSHV